MWQLAFARILLQSTKKQARNKKKQNGFASLSGVKSCVCFNYIIPFSKQRAHSNANSRANTT